MVSSFVVVLLHQLCLFYKHNFRKALADVVSCCCSSLLVRHASSKYFPYLRCIAIINSQRIILYIQLPGLLGNKVAMCLFLFQGAIQINLKYRFICYVCTVSNSFRSFNIFDVKWSNKTHVMISFVLIFFLQHLRCIVMATNHIKAIILMKCD